jgi:hypothetical protein
LHGDVVAADDPEDLLGVVADDGFTFLDIETVHRGQRGKLDFIIEPGGGDRLSCGNGVVQTLPQTGPRDFPRVHHCGFAVRRSEVMSNGVSLLVRKGITKRVTRRFLREQVWQKGTRTIRELDKRKFVGSTVVVNERWVLSHSCSHSFSPGRYVRW